MAKSIVKKHTRHEKGKIINVDKHTRKKRKKSKKRIVSNKPVKLYPIRDEYGQLQGFKNKP